MPATHLDPELIRSDAQSGAATDLLDAIDLIIAKINEVIDGGGGTSDAQRFIYTANGTETDKFTLPLPSARADANYNVQICHLKGVADTIKTISVIDGTLTTTGFNVELSTALAVGEKLMVDVVNRT